MPELEEEGEGESLAIARHSAGHVEAEIHLGAENVEGGLESCRREWLACGRAQSMRPVQPAKEITHR